MKNQIILLTLLFTSFFLNAQTTREFQKDSIKPPSSFELVKIDGKRAFGGIKNAFTQPLRWEKDDFIVAGSVVLGTAALYSVDEKSSDFFMKQKREIPSFIREAGLQASPEHLYLFNGAVYLVGLATKDEKIRETGLLLVSSSTAAGIILAMSKLVVGRARPYSGLGKGNFEPFSSQEAQHSFPSGHALFSVTTAYAIGKQFENPYLKAGIYGLGLVGPTSRLWEGAHWLTDVTLSIALGVAVVDGMDHYLTNKKHKDNSGIQWDIEIGLGSVGLRGTF